MKSKNASVVDFALTDREEPEEGEVRGEVDTEVEDGDAEAEGEAPKAEPENGNEE